MPDKMAFQSNVGEKGMRSDYIMRQRNGNKWPANQSSALCSTCNKNRGKGACLYSGKYGQQLAIPVMVFNGLEETLQVAVKGGAEAGRPNTSPATHHKPLRPRTA
jgi:hypothetical protein